MGSTSTTLAALMRVLILSACVQNERLAWPIPNPTKFPASSYCAAAVAFRRWLQLRVIAYGDLDAIIGEDERRIGRCQLSGRHLEYGEADSALVWAERVSCWCSRCRDNL